MKKEKIQLEYVFQNISVNVLWNHIGTASGLAEWFADQVEVEGRIFHFKWGDYSQEAEMIQLRTGSFIRFRWADDVERTYFEFKLMMDELIPQVALIITDFALPEDKNDTIMLWNKQIGALKQRTGM